MADLPGGVDERPFLCADPVRIGRVGESPGDFREQAVAQVGRRFDLARVERVSLGTDGEAQYANGASRIPFREVDGWIDPFRVIRAAASCAVDRGVGGRAIADALRRSGPEAAAGPIEGMAGRGGCREGARGVAAYLRRHAGRIGGGPSMGTTEAERQHVYKVRMGSFPCAWPPEGADARARARSWLLSGFGLPRRAREGSLSEARGAQGREAREARVLAARKPCTIRGEGVGVPPRRLGGRAGLRRQVQGVRRRPLGSSANINLMPTCSTGIRQSWAVLLHTPRIS